MIFIRLQREFFISLKLSTYKRDQWTLPKLYYGQKRCGIFKSLSHPSSNKKVELHALNGTIYGVVRRTFHIFTVTSLNPRWNIYAIRTWFNVLARRKRFKSEINDYCSVGRREAHRHIYYTRLRWEIGWVRKVSLTAEIYYNLTWRSP
jgi:hypothetical protein